MKVFVKKSAKINSALIYSAIINSLKVVDMEPHWKTLSSRQKIISYDFQKLFLLNKLPQIFIVCYKGLLCSDFLTRKIQFTV